MLCLDRMLFLDDRLPGVDVKEIDAIYVPGLGLTYDKKRLTVLNKTCMKEAVGGVPCASKWLIYSGCYDGEVMERELALRRQIALQGFNDSQIREIRGIDSTRDELLKLALVLGELNAKNVLFISDEYHMPRLVRWARLIMPTGMEIFNMSVEPDPPVYEFVWEPSLVKTIRSGIKPLWIAWNAALYYATPLFFRK